MLPKVIFKYSWIYDNHFKHCHSLWLKNDQKRTKYNKYPSNRQVLSYSRKVEKLWNKQEIKILKEISNVSGLKWKVKNIDCYIVGYGIAFSDPLTISTYYKSNKFIDILTHELIHQIFIQNFNITKKSWKYFHKKYKNKSITTRIHIVLHAIHSKIYYRLFSFNNLNRDIRASNSQRDYKISWEIVNKEGYENIINEFKERIKK